jgi:predicted enzyme related to lactoylglutathione lyase
VGDWLWRELWTHDVDAALGFYGALAEYEVEKTDFREREYSVLKTSDTARAGVLLAPEDVNPLWLPYVRVEDPAAIADHAARLGARVVMQSDDAAILIDPTGAPLGVQAWDFGEDSLEEGTR